MVLYPTYSYVGVGHSLSDMMVSPILRLGSDIILGPISFITDIGLSSFYAENHTPRSLSIPKNEMYKRGESRFTQKSKTFCFRSPFYVSSTIYKVELMFLSFTNIFLWLLCMNRARYSPRIAFEASAYAFAILCKWLES